MNENVSINELQIAANVIVMKRHLRFTGMINMIIGIVLVILLSIFDAHSRGTYLSVIGLSLIGVGILSIVRPSMTVMLIDPLPWIGIFVWSIILANSFIDHIQVSLSALGYIFITI